MYTTIISAPELFAQLDNPQWIIFDCRFNVTQPSWGREQYHGGHIPGALNRPLADNMGSDGRFLSSQQLRDYYAPLCRERVIHYCGSGVTACHNLLAMEVASLGLQ